MIKSRYNEDSYFSHPETQTVSDGSFATFRISVSGRGPFFFEWMRNGHTAGRKYRTSYSISSQTIHAGAVVKYTLIIVETIEPQNL
ncbi:MAG: hypothetical protein PVI26_03420 [Chitinispirillia bacterium]